MYASFILTFAMHLFRKCCPHHPDAGLLLLRLGLAAVFITHGVMKLQNMDGTIAFFSSLGMPAVMAWLVALVETLGGISMLFGIYTCIAGALLAVVMLFAIILVKGKMGFVGGWEFDLSLLLMALAVVKLGPGKFTICPLIHKDVCTNRNCHEKH